MFFFRITNPATGTVPTAVPMMLVFKMGKSAECTTYRCKKSTCVFLKNNASEVGNDAVHADDNEGNIMQAMAAQLGSDEENDADGDAADEAAQSLLGMTAGEENGTDASDAKMVDTCVFSVANNKSYYETIFQGLGKLSEMEATVIITATGHPASWYVRSFINHFGRASCGHCVFGPMCRMAEGFWYQWHLYSAIFY